jgi:tRNA nucleotidyltransferase (CCA-adding enzyme)
MRKLPGGLGELSDIFAAAGYKLYLVGGYVRNNALGLSGGDLDVCSCALPYDAAFSLREAGLKVIEKAPELGTIEAHLYINGKKYIFEHTTFRRDFYPQGGNHRPDSVVFTKDIKEDATRRDFTVNALYLDIASGETLDPTGKGLSDASRRLIRAAAEDPDITIRDDGLRIMRMARFAAELGFAVCPDLMECVKKRAYLLKDIAAERKRDELKKILIADTKYGMPGAPEKGLSILRQSGALPYILPGLSDGDGVKQSEVYHKYDVLGHGIHACAAAPPLLELRLAALLHDIGKPAALREGGNMYGHEVLGEWLAAEEMELLKFENSIDVVLPLVRWHMFDLEGRAKPKTIRKRAVKLGREIFSMLIALRRADFTGSGMELRVVESADNWQRELETMDAQNVPWSVKELKINGEDVMKLLGIPPSPNVGAVLGRLHSECVAHPSSNNYETLKKLVLAHGSNLLL